MIHWQCKDNKTTTEWNSESQNISEIEKKDKDYVIIYDVIKETNLYAEPTEKSVKLINQKATKRLGSVYYLSIDKSCKVKILESSNNWSKIQVVEPDWLADSHIGWVKSNVLQNSNDKIEAICEYQENKDYQILYSTLNGNVTNYHIILLWKNFDEDSVEKLSNCIKKDKFPNSNCNINIYDSADIIYLIDRYPLEGKDYINFADHYVYVLSFDGFGMYYPYKDFLYKEYGGKKPIR